MSNEQIMEKLKESSDHQDNEELVKKKIALYVINKFKSENEKLEAKTLAQEKIINEFIMIKDESNGISGWHLNGDICYWHEFSDLNNYLDDFNKEFYPENCI